MKLSAPWMEFYHQVEALFERDPEVKVIYNDEEKEIKLYVENALKADALTKLLPTEKAFGNVVVKVAVVPANEMTVTNADLIAEAFEGNPALKYVQHVDALIGAFDYAVFESKVVQYYNDNLGDINGNCSTLYQDIAREVFGDQAGVFFCTEAVNAELTKPLGEWP